MSWLIQVFQGDQEVIDTLWLIHRLEWPLSARAARMLEWLNGYF
ncbi:hypothetical protein [Pseudomonas abieticivorans]|nr:hypothetical protein [Pseudomonas sp. PIA16]